MDVRQRTPQPPPNTAAAMDDREEEQGEAADEPPDAFEWSSTKILSETEHTDEEEMPPPPRTMSTQSTWSNPSTTSMAELTSDDGRSVTSPAISPPLPPTHRNTHHVSEKHLETKVKIVGEDHVLPGADNKAKSEKSVEENLGRKRCISFACRGKDETKVVSPPTSEPQHQEPASPPKRKCALKFVCPTRSGSDSKLDKVPTKRPASPPPPHRRSASNGKHRGSDSTVTHMSPKSTRKNTITNAKPETPDEVPQQRPRKNSSDSSDDEGGDSVRFHEFGTSDSEPEAWVQESTCHRSRLTVNDTLKKENVIRKTCEEVEEEAIEEEEDEEDEELDEELNAVAEMDDHDADLEEEDEYESDEGFHSDDEEGFANSDSDSDDGSDYEWWKPGVASTAATSVEHLDRLAIVNSNHVSPSSSHGSASSVQMSRRSSKASLKKVRSKARSTAVSIPRAGSPDLPDSTDFVCGTLDEDRPLEQAYINKRNAKDAANHKVRPQDIDPTFPTSDPEMDEEDDDDVEDIVESETDGMMHGELDEIHGTAKKVSPTRQRGRSNSHRSPPPPTTRMHSPPPAKRAAPRSPPPPTKRAKSPAPRKLFNRSPNRPKSPAPVKRMTSPPNSPTFATAQLATAPRGLAGRPQLTHTASLPRGGPITLSKLATISDGEEADSDHNSTPEIPKRGAIDIVKGVEFKRQRRKEKLYQKLCAKQAAKGEKTFKVKPGKGAERMREVGLQLQEYQGKGGHILSL